MYKKKFLMLYLKTGGGHLAPAKAISNYMAKHFPEAAEPVLADCFEEAPRWVKFIIEDGYRITQSKAKWLFEFLYAINKFKIPAAITCFAVGLFIKPYLKKIIRKENPHKIVCLHFFILQPLFGILKKEKLSIPVKTLVTDPFTPHTMWFLNKKQDFILFSDQLGEKIKSKLPESKVDIFPFILDEKFSNPVPEREITGLRIQYGINPDKKVLLILGGGDGIPHGRRILESVLNAKMNISIIIVCGKNKELFRNAELMKEKYPEQKLIVYGYVDFVYNLVNASDIVITKCGASTIMEILLLKKVPVVNDYIWEQEKGNVDFLIEHKLGIYEPRLSKIPEVINELLMNEEKLNFYKSNINNYGLQNGTGLVSEYLLKN